MGGIPVVGSLSSAVLQRARSGDLTEADLAAVRGLTRELRVGGARVVAVLGVVAPADAAAFAVAWAAAVRERADSVVVIDTDLAAPAPLHSVPGPREDLLAALTGRHWPDSSEDSPPFRFYGATAPAPDAASLLAEPVFANLVAQLRETVGLVLLLVPDRNGSAAVLRQAEAGLLLLRPGKWSQAVEVSAARLAGGVQGSVAAVVAGA